MHSQGLPGHTLLKPQQADITSPRLLMLYGSTRKPIGCPVMSRVPDSRPGGRPRTKFPIILETLGHHEILLRVLTVLITLRHDRTDDAWGRRQVETN